MYVDYFLRIGYRKVIRRSTRFLFIWKMPRWNKLLRRSSNRVSIRFGIETMRINLGRKVSVNINNQNIANVLDRLLATQGLVYTINEKHIVIYKTNEKASHPMITNNKKNNRKSDR